ncbi:hypothetical protein WL05_06285 [Burkholderia ubonensis]|nr:hypothetical protein WJ52_03080 [Burkholderia ubonensis]KVM54444.1 hypothetical protein WJ56_06450 [Burkholderia ubonensis]KVX56158.1 hypothetical protein WL05_06285 [Burkholderia ubonensis]
MPTVGKLDMYRLAGTHADDTATDSLDRIAQIAYKIDRADCMTLAANLFQLQADAFHCALREAPCGGINFFRQQFGSASSRRAG